MQSQIENKKRTKADWQVFLVNQGYTVSSAARHIHRSQGHVSLVIDGKRTSAEVESLLLSLPRRPYIARERLAACK